MVKCADNTENVQKGKNSTRFYASGFCYDVKVRIFIDHLKYFAASRNLLVYRVSKKMVRNG